MPSISHIKYISLDNLQTYTNLLKQYISTADADSIKFVDIEETTLRFYKDLPTTANPNPAVTYEIKLPDPDFSEIEAQFATLIGDDKDKSIRMIASEELARELIPDNAKESLDTIKEIAQWIQDHPDDASKMASDIADIRKLIGEIPEGATASDIVNYIAASVQTETDRAKAVESAIQKSVVDLTNSTITREEKNDILDKVQAVSDALDTKVTKETYDADIADINQDIQMNKASIKQNAADIATKANQTALDATNVRVTANEKSISTINDTLETKANQVDLEATNKNVATNTRNIALKANQTDLNDANENIAYLTTQMQTKAAQSDMEAVVDKVTENGKNIATLQTKTTTLIGDDQGKSVRKIANEELTKQLIPADAKESLDTLKEIAEWIQNHPDDAASMGKDIEDLKTNKADVATVTDLADNVGDIENRVTTAEADIDALETRATADEETLAKKANQTSLDETNTNVSKNTEDISEINVTLATKADQTALDTTNKNVAANATEIAKKAAQSDLDATNVRVTTLEDSVAKQTDLSALQSRMTTAEGEIDDLQTDTSTISGKVNTLIGTDANKSVRTIASEELAKELIPENAKDALDTIAEIAAWIQSHPDDAAAMNTAITALQTRLTGDETTLKGTIKSLSASGTTITITYVDGSTKTITTKDTTYSNATATAAGLMSSADKTKLDGVETGANKTVVDSALSSSSTNPVQNKVINTALGLKANQTDLSTANSKISSLETNQGDLSKLTTEVKTDLVSAINEAASGGSDPNVLGILMPQISNGNDAGLTYEFSYNDDGNLISGKVYDNDTGSTEADDQLKYEYDNDGNLIKYTENNGSGITINELTYNSGNIVKITSSYLEPIDKDNPSWATLAAQVKSGAAETLYSVGDTFTDSWKYNNNGTETTYDATWQIDDFQSVELEDGSSVNAMQIEFKYLPPFTMQFHRPEAFYAATDGLSAGTYYITRSSSNWQFTLTKDVEAGGRLAFHSTTSDSSTSSVDSYMSDGKTILETVSTTSGTDGTSLGTMSDYARNGDVNGYWLTRYGNGRYMESHVRQWLNSSAGPNEWWTPSTKWDIAPYSTYYNKAGFLYGLSQDLIDAMLPSKIITYPANIYGSDPDIVYDKVWLPSLNQMYINPQKANEGDSLQYYKDLNGTSTKYQQYSTYPALKKYIISDQSSSNLYWTRSACADAAYYAWYVYSFGYVDSSNAYRERCAAGLANIGNP